MKTIIRIFFMGLLLFPLQVFAQQATEKREYYHRVEWSDLQGYSERVSYNVPIYYDEDDNVIKHGLLKINHKSDLTARLGQKCILTYNVSGNYANGKLNGAFTIEKAATITQGTLKSKASLNFVNGDPTGTWTFTETAIRGGQTQTLTCTVTIKDNQFIAYNSPKSSFQINDDNTFSGKIDGNVYKNCINTSIFIRKTGEKTKPDENVQSIISAFIGGTMSEADLLSKGFAFDVYSNWIYYFDFELLDYLASKLPLGHFMTDSAVSASISSMEAATHLNKNISSAYTVKRVNVISTEELVDKVGTMKTTNKITDSTNWISWDDTDGNRYLYCYNTNNIEISGNVYYFTEESKVKLEETIKAYFEERRLEQERIAEEKRKEQERIAEEKRKEQERIAEEKRKEEIEKQKELIQPICNYLKYYKTPLQICYGDTVSRFFDPTGLSASWSLDLEKLIKPFCKIVDCKVISYEPSTKVAVLEITKQGKKKVNIVYHVPVVIEKGRIVVTSIDFSKATVVE